MDGPGESYSEDGHLKSRGTYKSGKEDGLWEGYYSDGQLESKILYRDGKIQGLLEQYYENGQLMGRGTLNMGEQCGEWIEQDGPKTYLPCPPGLKGGN